jgi:amidase
VEQTERSIAQWQQLMESGAASAVEIALHYLARIDAIDRNGPTLRSVLEVNPDAAAIAAELDDERRRSGPRGPLHGIPVVLKDNIDTGDRMTTTAGSLALEGHRAPADAFLVARLRAAGAVVLGKTNLSEWANARSSRSSSGWSSRGGQTRNPYALDRNPCGSSSGSGVAVAADLAAGAVGTETDGSIICPASVNGVVGVKPTLGLVSRTGIIPVAASQDTAGPMARSVADAAILLSAMAGTDPRDTATAGASAHAAPDYRAFLGSDGLRGARLGVVRSCCGKHEGADAVFERALETLRELGAEIVDGVDLSGIAAVREHEVRVMRVELKAGIDAYLRERPDAPVRSLADVIAFNAQHAERVMPYFRQEFLEMAQAEAGLDDPAYLEALAACRRIARDEGIDRALGEQRLDALVAPTGTPAWVTDPIDGDRLLGLCASPAAVAGYPHVTVPAGFVHGLPVGLSLFAGPWQERRLLAYAYAFEQAADARRPPTFPERVA